MPRLEQIIPEYQVPHVRTYINDNSAISSDPTANANPDGTRFLCVFASPKGEDGVIKTITNTTDFLEEYGTPDYKLYGQAQYNAYAALSTGNAICHCLRVSCVEDSDEYAAGYANQVICLAVKAVATESDNPAYFGAKIVLKPWTSGSSTKLKTKGELDAYLNTLVGTKTDDGYKIYPIIGIQSNGKGAYGNSLSIRLVKNSTYIDNTGFMDYTFEVLDSYTGNLYKKESFIVSLDDGAIINNKSFFVNDVINDPESGSGKIIVTVKPESITGIYNEYKAFIADSYASESVEDVSAYDFFSGTIGSGSTAIPHYTIAADNSVSHPTGIKLVNGNDGCFDANFENVVDDSVIVKSRELALENAYIAAFSTGSDTNNDDTAATYIDPSIRSKRAFPADFILDAGFSDRVKAAIAELALHRYDARCIIDCGTTRNTVSAVTTWLNTNINAFNDPIFSKEICHYKIRDPFTGRPIDVTATYFIASHYPIHEATYGNHIPFVTETYTLVDDMIPRSMKPDIDADMIGVKDTLYGLRANFFECTGSNRYARAIQTTAQKTLTDLSEENNMLVVLDMKRQLEEYVSSILYDFADAEDRQRFTDAATRMFSSYRGNKVKSYDVFFDMNSFEEERSILHCYLSVVFRTTGKRGIIEIDINPRIS